MPFAPVNVILEHALQVGATLLLPYPEGRNEGHFFGATNHSLAINGTFFRSPRDFIVITRPDRITFVWKGEFTLPAGALLNMQLEIPGGDYYYDTKLGVTVPNLVHSPLFMVNLASPGPAEENYWLPPQAITEPHTLKLTNTQTFTARNVVVRSSGDNAHCIFTVEGEDIYRRPMIEKITGPSAGISEGKKAFAKVHRIMPSQTCNSEVWIGKGNKLGLPVFLPSPGYLLREIINGVAVTGGTVVSGETAVPTATTGDRRGTYTPPPDVILDNRHSIHLLLSLLAPGNIGIPDYAG